MEMKKINAGKLRAIGYDARERILRVEFDDGTAIDYSGVGSEVWRRFSTSGAAWSFYRDNIDEEFAGKRGGPRWRTSVPSWKPCSAGAPSRTRRSRIRWMTCSSSLVKNKTPHHVTGAALFRSR